MEWWYRGTEENDTPADVDDALRGLVCEGYKIVFDFLFLLEAPWRYVADFRMLSDKRTTYRMKETEYPITHTIKMNQTLMEHTDNHQESSTAHARPNTAEPQSTSSRSPCGHYIKLPWAVQGQILGNTLFLKQTSHVPPRRSESTDIETRPFQTDHEPVVIVQCRIVGVGWSR